MASHSLSQSLQRTFMRQGMRDDIQWSFAMPSVMHVPSHSCAMK